MPTDIQFATKPEPARRTLERAFAASVLCRLGSGRRDLRRRSGAASGLEAERHPYVLAISASHAVWRARGTQQRVDALVASLPVRGMGHALCRRGEAGGAPLTGPTCTSPPLYPEENRVAPPTVERWWARMPWRIVSR